jgi:hypothetical protein
MSKATIEEDMVDGKSLAIRRSLGRIEPETIRNIWQSMKDEILHGYPTCWREMQGGEIGFMDFSQMNVVTHGAGLT